MVSSDASDSFLDLGLSIEETQPPQKFVSCVDVAVPVPVPGPFSYRITDEQEQIIQVGVRVRVPFRNREIIGYVVAVEPREFQPRLKSVMEVLDPNPVISERMLAMTKWIGEEYGATWGEAIENALPRWVKYGKKAERALKKMQDEVAGEVAEKKEFTLSVDQQKAMQLIQEEMGKEDKTPILLFGVTGSGKSEVYIRAIKETLSKKKSAIVLVPEIALTEQLRLFFFEHFGNRLEILHSKLNDTEKFLAWKRLESGDRDVVLGPRSAIFAPLTNLGLIVMDEEHEGSYKQETVPRYHAREVATWRAKQEKALFMMGSATPSLETMHRCDGGDVLRVEMLSRIDDRKMPEVMVVDMKHAIDPRKKKPILSIPLASEIEKNLAEKEGTMLLLNRRGYSTHIYDSATGEIKSCPSCEVSLTYHQEDDVFLCHYCNYQKSVSELMASSTGGLMKFSGFGTEKIESDVASRWPQARIARLDADTVRKKGSHEVILKDFRDKKIDILIGTQMIAKGFDFPHVTLVGVVLADVGLMLPDFRSSERTFQLLTQVAGRAGRGEKPGRVVVQTYSPQHPSVLCAKDHDYLSFYSKEMPTRKELDYPPFHDLINYIIRSKDEKQAYLYAREWRDLMKKEISSSEGVVVIGPSPLPFYKLRGHFRWHVMLKVPSKSFDKSKLWEIATKIKKSSRVAVAVDVNPVNIL